jgi:membrane protein YqaA with SNARE-associated domain
MIWPAIAALLTSIGFGAVSAVMPVANAEAYVIASQMSSVAGVLPIAAGVGVGQTIGKLLLFLGVRRGKQFRFVRHQREKIRVATVGPVRQQFRSVIGTLLRLVGTARWGLPIVFLAAVVGFPPLYAVALLAGATRMSIVRFGVVVLVGRITRFVLVALGVTGLYLS